VINGDATQPTRLGAAGDPAKVFRHYGVESAAADQVFQLLEFFPVKPLAFSFGGDDDVFDGALMERLDFFFPVI
jgi:hypothetical protein